jgi:hypothetical protein
MTSTVLTQGQHKAPTTLGRNIGTDMDTNDSNTPKKRGRPKGLPKTGGNVKGRPPKVARETKVEIAAFFSELTASNYRWRLRVKRILDGRGTLQDFHKWSLIALDRTLGTPGKHQEAVEQRNPFIFATLHGYLPWDARAPAAAEMNARSVRMIEGRAEEIKVQAEARAVEAAEKVIEAKADHDTDLEALESVSEPPETFGGGGRGR